MIDQISESDVELKRCLTSYHVDYFLYKLEAEKFVTFFSLLAVSSNDRVRELLTDSRSARAYDACLLVSGEKAAKLTSKSNTNACNKLKECLTCMGEYFVTNFDEILDTQMGIFAMRSFLKIIGKFDPLEAVASVAGSNSSGQQKNNNKRADKTFSMKTYEYKCLPDDWQLQEYLKKFYKLVKDKNILGKKI